MAKQVINTGTIANDGTGDTLKEGADKINSNFTELYNLVETGLVQVNSDWEATSGVAEILNKPELFSGSYEDLTNVPAFADVATSGSYVDLADKPHLSSVATSGSYTDLSNLPTLFSGSYSDLSNKPVLFSGSYSDLTNKPTIPNNTDQLINGAGFVTSSYVSSSLTWNNITSKPTFATVATSGSYSDLTNKPLAYSLPTASTSTLGGVKVDGTTVVIDGNGVISSAGGGTALPSNSQGYLYNSGTGALAWASSIPYTSVSGRPTLALVATSGLYENLTGTPFIPSTLLHLNILDGTAGQVLTTNGVGQFSFTTVSGGGAMASRTTASGTTSSIANGATGNISITGFKSYMLLKVVVSDAAWVRIYTDTSSRTADASRVEGTDPAPGAGVIAEVITTGAQTILISPAALGFSNEASPTTSIPVAVTNKSGSTTTITVVLHLLQLEA